MTTNENPLALIEGKNPLDFYSVAGGLDPLIEKIRAEVMNVVPDVTSKKGRNQIASLAHKVACSKTAIDNLGKKCVADIKAKAKLIDAERARAWDAIEAIQHAVRKPLTEFEDREKARIAEHERLIAELDMLRAAVMPTAEKLELLACIPLRNWQEFEQKFIEKRNALQIELEAKLREDQRIEAERAELERLRAEEQARLQKERDERIAAEAAARAKAQAEADARKAAEEVAARTKAEVAKAEAERQRIENEARAAHERAVKAEADRLAAQEKAKKDAEEAEQRRLRDVAAAEQRERERATAIAKAEADALAAREADKHHRDTIKRHAANAILGIIFSDDPSLANQAERNTAMNVVKAIEAGQIPNVKLVF